MSKHRFVHVAFWQDAFVLDLTPEEKYFYLYLMTNSKTSQVGIYELPKRVVELETGYHRETVDKLLQRFIDYGKIKYCEETKEIMLVNWIKHNWNSSKNVLTHVANILEEVKNKDFVSEYLEQAENSGVARVEIDKISPLQAPSKPLEGLYKKEKEKEKEKHKEKEPQKEKETNQETENVVGVIFDTFQELGFGTINSYTAEQIDEHLKTFEPEVLIKAMQIASNSNKRTLGYVNGILKNWKDRNIINLKAIEAAEKQRETELAIQGPRYSKVNNREEEKPKWLAEKENDSSVKESKAQEPLKTLTEDEDFRKLIANFRDDEAKN